jgi:hypothetical protein
MGHLVESKYEANFAFSFDLNLDLVSLFKLIEAKVGGVLLLIIESWLSIHRFLGPRNSNISFKIVLQWL